MTLAQSFAGIQSRAANALLAEIDTDMSHFPSDKYLASGDGVCPDNKQSGSKRLSGATTVGNPYLRAILGKIA